MDNRTVERRKTPWSLMPLFPLCVGDIAPYRIGLFFMTLLVWRFVTRSSWSINSIRHSKQKRSFSNSNIKDGIFHRGKNFQTELILGVIGDDIILGNRT
jgi:hypothetical protein